MSLPLSFVLNVMIAENKYLISLCTWFILFGCSKFPPNNCYRYETYYTKYRIFSDIFFSINNNHPTSPLPIFFVEIYWWLTMQFLYFFCQFEWTIFFKTCSSFFLNIATYAVTFWIYTIFGNKTEYIEKHYSHYQAYKHQQIWNNYFTNQIHVFSNDVVL